MDLSWDLCKFFYYVCEYKSITKVAEHFFLSQPAVTKKIKNLEQQLGTTLIYRNNKGIQVTEEGQKLYDLLKPAISVFSDIESEYCQPLQDGNTTIRLSASYIAIEKLILPMITKFNAKYPNIQFKIETSPFDDSAKKLKENKLDLLFYGYDRLQYDNDNIIKKECYSMEHGFVISTKIKNDLPEIISVYDINKYPVLVIDSAGESRMELESILHEKNIQLNPKQEFSTFWALKNSVENNKGIGFLDIKFVKKEIENGTLMQIPTVEKLPQVPLYCAYQRNNYNKKYIQEFINLLRENY